MSQRHQKKHELAKGVNAHGCAITLVVSGSLLTRRSPGWESVMTF
ncbi:hypothetical protein [Stenotrophomonas phage CM2]